MKNKKTILLTFLALLTFSVSSANFLDGPAVGVYDERDNSPKYKTFDGSFSNEQTAVNIGSYSAWLESAGQNRGDEAILLSSTNSNAYVGQVWDGASWGNSLTLSSSADKNFEGMDVAYESQSGDAVVVYGIYAKWPQYRVWDGASWSSEEDALRISNRYQQVQEVELSSNPTEDELMLLTTGSQSEIDAQIWNGNSWTNKENIGSSVPGQEPIATTFTSKGAGIAIWDDGSGTPNYRIWNGSWESPGNTADIEESMEWAEIDANRTGEEAVLATIDSNGDIEAQVWDGSSWGNLESLKESGSSSTERVDVEYTHSGEAMVMYSTGDSTPKYKLWNGSSWSDQKPASEIGGTPQWIELTSHPNTDEVLANVKDGNNKAYLQVWDGSSWEIDNSNGNNPAEQNSRIAGFYSVADNELPELGNLTGPTEVKTNEEITIQAENVSDAENDRLGLYCSFNQNPTSSNSILDNAQEDESPYDFNYTYSAQDNEASKTVFCRTKDDFGYSTTQNLSYTVDGTPPQTSIVSVAGDKSATFTDTEDDDKTEIVVDGESGMACRYSQTDESYSSMPSGNSFSVSGSQATATPDLAQGTPDIYVSCQDERGNEQTASNNLDITSLVVDYTAPTTDVSNEFSSSTQTPPYTVTIVEEDNTDGDPETEYCLGSGCTPDKSIDDGGQITFDSSDRGENILRFNSTDFVGETQATKQRNVSINQLPTLSSVSDNATTIQGGATVQVNSTSSDPENPPMTMYVCSSVGASASGCSGENLCTASGTANLSCSFESETDTGEKDYYTYLYDANEEASNENPVSGDYATDSTPPILSIDDPENITYTQDDVGARFTGNEDLSTGLYGLDGGSNKSMSRVSSLSFSSTLSNLSEGQHQIKFYANDSYGNTGSSEIRYFTVNAVPDDTTPPTLSPTNPTNNSFVNTSDISANFTADEDLSSAKYRLDDGSNTSMSNTSTTDWYKKIKGLNTGSHNLTFFGTDIVGNTGSSYIEFTTDLNNPAFSEVSADPDPANQSEDVECSAYWTDSTSGLENAFVSENSSGSFTNHSVTVSGANAWTNYTIPSSDHSVGTVECRFYAEDVAGNTESTSTSFTVEDRKKPELSIVSPGNVTYAQDSITAEFTSNEEVVSGLYDYEGSNQSLNNLSGTRWRKEISGLADDTYNIIFWGKDAAGNWGRAEETFTIDAQADDTTPPVFSIINPTNKSVIASDSTYINITASENISAGGINYSLDGSSNESLNNDSTTDWYKQLSGLSEGTHSVKYYGKDTADNLGTALQEFTVDTEKPTASNIQVQPSTPAEGEDIKCSAYWSDSTSGLENGYVSENISGSFTNHTIPVNGANSWTNYSISSSDTSKVSYECRFYAEDRAGNIDSVSQSFEVEDVTPPSITVTFPRNKTYNTEDVSVSVSTNESADTAWYSLNGNSNQTLTKNTPTSFSDTLESLNDDSYTIEIWANDTSGNTAESREVQFTVDAVADDTTPPSLTVQEPQNNTHYNSSILLNITSSEALSNASYSLDKGAFQGLGNISTASWNKKITPDDGEHAIVFNGTDLVGNKEQTETYSIDYDTTLPSLEDSGVKDPDNTGQTTCYSKWSDRNLDTGKVYENATDMNHSVSFQNGYLNYSFSPEPGDVECKFYATDKAGNTASNTTVKEIQDLKKPVIESFNTPTEEEADPNKQINFTAKVSDYEIDTVKLQYNKTDGRQNTTMFNNSGTFQSNFTGEEGNYTVRVFANDTSGNKVLSEEKELEVAFEKELEVSESIGSPRNVRLENEDPFMNVGNVTLKNKGDLALNLTVSSNRDWVEVNDSVERNINLSSLERQKLNITANTTDFPTERFDFNVSITGNSSETLEESVLIQSERGPSLETSFQKFSSQLTQGETYEYIVHAENGGTTNAESTNIELDIPESFTVVSGTLNRSIGEMLVGGTSTSTIQLKPTEGDAEYNLMASSVSARDSDTITRTLTVGTPPEPVIEEETEVVSEPGGASGTAVSGGSAQLTQEQSNRLFETEEDFEVVRGTNETFSINFTNPIDYKLNNVSVELDGFLSQYLQLENSDLGTMDVNETRQIELNVTAPDYYTSERKELVFTITGVGDTGRQEFNLTEKKTVNLLIQEISRETAEELVNQSRTQLNRLSADGYQTGEVETMLSEMKTALNENRYSRVKEINQEVENTISNARNTRNTIQELERSIQSSEGRGIEAERSKRTLRLAEEALERGDFETASSRLTEAEDLYALETKGEFNLVSFIMRNKFKAAGGSAATLFFALFSFYRLKLNRMESKLENLKTERKSINDEIKELQKDAFRKDEISLKEYEKKLSSHKDRMMEISERQVALVSKISAWENFRNKKSRLHQEEDRIRDLIQDTQRNYIDRDHISSESFEKRERKYRERLTEIKEELAEIEAHEKIGGGSYLP